MMYTYIHTYIYMICRTGLCGQSFVMSTTLLSEPLCAKTYDDEIARHMYTYFGFANEQEYAAADTTGKAPVNGVPPGLVHGTSDMSGKEPWGFDVVIPMKEGGTNYKEDHDVAYFHAVNAASAARVECAIGIAARGWTTYTLLAA